MSVSRVYRLLRLITMLQSRRSYGVNELVRELEVSRRTVFRDLNMLEMARIPYHYDSRTGGYRISEHFFLPSINLTLAEALAMLVLTGRMRGGGSVPLLSAARRAGMKVENALPQAVRDNVGSLLAKVSVDTGGLARHEGLEDTFDALAGAMAHRNVCRIIYISFYERKQISLTVHPLRLLFRERAWYMLAWSKTHRQVRTFKLGRIRKLTVTDKTFAPPPEEAVEDRFGLAWGMIPEGRLYDVRIRFARKVAGNVAEVGWHPTQRVEWNRDGSADLLARVDGLGEITWWILGYGDQAEVIEPPELRRRVRQVAGNMVRAYGKEGC